MNPFARKKGVKLNATVDPTGSLRGHSLQELADACGYIPAFITHREPGERAQSCLNRTYSHGGGWQPFPGFTADDDGILRYPEDPPMVPYVKIRLDDVKQDVFIYGHGVVMVREDDQSYEVARLD